MNSDIYFQSSLFKRWRSTLYWSFLSFFLSLLLICIVLFYFFIAWFFLLLNKWLKWMNEINLAKIPASCFLKTLKVLPRFFNFKTRINKTWFMQNTFWYLRHPIRLRGYYSADDWAWRCGPWFCDALECNSRCLSDVLQWRYVHVWFAAYIGPAAWQLLMLHPSDSHNYVIAAGVIKYILWRYLELVCVFHRISKRHVSLHAMSRALRANRPTRRFIQRLPSRYSSQAAFVSARERAAMKAKHPSHCKHIGRKRKCTEKVH